MGRTNVVYGESPLLLTLPLSPPQAVRKKRPTASDTAAKAAAEEEELWAWAIYGHTTLRHMAVGALAMLREHKTYVNGSNL